MKKKDTSDIGSLIKKGQFFLAQKKIEELISSEPNNLSYRNILAIIYANQKNFKDSIIILKKIIKQSPKFIDAYINLFRIAGLMKDKSYRHSLDGVIWFLQSSSQSRKVSLIFPPRGLIIA